VSSPGFWKPDPKSVLLSGGCEGWGGQPVPGLLSALPIALRDWGGASVTDPNDDCGLEGSRRWDWGKEGAGLAIGSLGAGYDSTDDLAVAHVDVPTFELLGAVPLGIGGTA
jgi:hypothetical protein